MSTKRPLNNPPLDQPTAYNVLCVIAFLAAYAGATRLNEKWTIYQGLQAFQLMVITILLVNVGSWLRCLAELTQEEKSPPPPPPPPST